MANNASAAETGNTTPVGRTGRQRKPNMRFADYEMDDTVRKIVTGVSTPQEGATKKTPGRGGSGGRKDGSGHRKDDTEQQKSGSGKRKEKIEDEKGLERDLADTAGRAKMATTSGTDGVKNAQKNVSESPISSSSNNSNSSSSSSRRSTRGQPYISPVKDDALKESGVSLTLVPVKQEKIKKFNLDTLKGRKFPVKGNMVVLDMKQSSIVTVKPKQIRDLIQVESKSSKVTGVPVKLETESVKLDSGPIKLSVTKLMCDESETEDSMRGSGVKNIFKIGDNDCDVKANDEKTPLLLRESEIGDKPKSISSNEANKVNEMLVSNLGNIDNEKKMENDISSDQVKPTRRGRRKLPRSKDGTDKLDEPSEVATKDGNQEKMGVQQTQSNDDKELSKPGMLNDDNTKIETIKASPIESDEANATSKRERDIDQKKAAESDKLLSMASPMLKKRKPSELSGDVDNLKDKDLEDNKSNLDTMEEEPSAKTDSKAVSNKNLKVEKESEISIKSPTENLEKNSKKHKDNDVSKNLVSHQEISNLPLDKNEVCTGDDQTKDNKKLQSVMKNDTSLKTDQSVQLASEKSQMTVKKEIKKENEPIPLGSKRKCDDKESKISDAEKKRDGPGVTKKLKVNDGSNSSEKPQSVFKDPDKEVEPPKDMMGIAHLMSFLKRPPQSTPPKEPVKEKPIKVEVKKEIVKKAEVKSFVKKNQMVKPQENVTKKKVEEKKEILKKGEENIESSEKSKDNKDEKGNIENNKDVKSSEKNDLAKKIEESKSSKFAEEQKTDSKKSGEKKDAKILAEKEMKNKKDDSKLSDEKNKSPSKIEKKIEDVKIEVKTEMGVKKDNSKITEEKIKSPSKIQTKLEDVKIVAKKEIEDKKVDIKVTEEKIKSPNKNVTKVENIKTTEGKRENNEKKKVESTSKPLLTVKKSEKISPKKAESPLSALMHEGKGEKRKNEESKKLEEKKKDVGSKKIEEEKVKAEKMLETKSKKIKLEDKEVQQTVDKTKKKGMKIEQEKILPEDRQMESKKQNQIDVEVGKKVKDEGPDLKAEITTKEIVGSPSPNKKQENVMDKLKIEDAKGAETAISEEKSKPRKGSRSSSNSPCRLGSHLKKSNKEKEVSPLDLLMKNVKETDTESDGSLSEIIEKKMGKRNKTSTKEKDVQSKLESCNKGKKKDKDDPIDSLPKKEGINKNVMHIEKSIDNVISTAMTEQAPEKVSEVKKENIDEKEVKVLKTEYNSPKIDVRKDDEKSKTPGKRKIATKNKSDELLKQTEEKKLVNEKKEEKSKTLLEKKKPDDEIKKKDEKRKIEEEKKQSEDEKKRKGVNIEDSKTKQEDEKRKRTDDKKKSQPKNDDNFETSKSSPAQRKMSQTSSNSPSRSTPRAARKLYKDKEDDVQKKEDDEKRKESEKISVKEQSSNQEKKLKDGKKKEEEKKAESGHKVIKDTDNKNKDDNTTGIVKDEEEKRKKTDEKKDDQNIEAAKSSPAQRKMSRSSSNSPSRPTPRSARKLYKDEDPKKKVEEEKKDNEKVIIKEETEICDKKEEKSLDFSHKIKRENDTHNEDIAMEIDSEDLMNTKEVKKDYENLKSEPPKELADNKDKKIKAEEVQKKLTELERLDAERKKKCEEEEREKRNKAVVDARMKSFGHLTENLYISERKKSKRNKELRRMTCDCYLTKEEISAGEVGCGDDCLNRLLMVECGSRCKTKEHCSNKRFQTRENADVEVFNADEKGCGVRARTDIEAGTFLMEYIGEVFDTREFKRRRREYAKDGGAHFYFMSLRSDEFIDATRKGNISRFVNHSCDPVAETQKWTVNGDLRIGFFSKKCIKAGEEITFDYRMERYGREPQKCYCGTAICRGWLGEAPDQKTKEEKEEDKKREEKERKRQDRRTSDDMDKMLEKDEEKERRDRRKPILDDMDLEDEIEKLACLGLRNRQDTLNLSRLMVRAMDEQSRLALLRLLRDGEPACRRLFLDYHGLRVLWSWMADIGSQQDNVKLKMEILTTLGELPITNRTQLIDSRVLNYVEKWSQISPSQKNSTTEASSSTKKTSDASEDSDTEVEGSSSGGNNAEGSNTSRLKAVESSSTDDSSSLDSNDATATHKSANSDESKVIEDENSDSNLSLPTKSSSSSSSSVSPSDNQEKQEQTEVLQNLVGTTLKLLDQWKNLKEAFRIPKKERIEMMKEHERQVDRNYQEFLVRNTTLDRGKSRSTTPSYYSSRIIRRSPDRDRERERHRARRNNNGDNDPSSDWSNLSKEERRQKFELKVQQEEEEANIRKEEEAAQRKMQEEMWQLHVDRCNLLCQDPYLTPILDPTCQYFWDPKENNWQPYTGPVPSLPVGGGLGHIPASEGESNSSSPQTQAGPNQLTTSPRASNTPWVTPSQPLPGNLAPDSDPAHPTGTNTNTFPGALGMDEDPLNPANIPLPGETSHVPQCSPSKTPSTPGGTDTSPTGTSILSSIPLPGEMARMPTPTTPTTPSTPVSTDLPLGTTVGVDEGLPPPAPVGPITITLPPKWKIARDPRGHIYFYHTKTRISQWEIPTMEQHKMLEQTLNIQDSDSDSVSSDDSDSSDSTDSEEFSSDEDDEDEDEEVKVLTAEDPELDEKMIRCPKGRKKRSAALVQERVISPICEIDREEARKERHKAKERAREEARQERHDRRQERVFEQGPHMQQQPYEDERQRREEKKSKNRHKDRAEMKERLSYALADNSDRARKIKENFKAEVAMFIVQVLNPYRRSDCTEGKIKSIDDFKYLGKKLTHFVLVKELRQLPNMESLEFSESVKNKTKDFINKYMKKFGDVFKRDPNDTKDYS